MAEAALFPVDIPVNMKGDERALRFFDKLQSKTRRSTSLLSGLTKVAGGVFAGFSIGKVVSDLVRVNMQFEDLRANLETVVGGQAGQAFDRIKTFAAETPFQVDNITRAFINLEALGIRATNERLESLGNIAAAFGRDITDIARGVQGAVTGEMEILKSFGIVARAEGDQLAVTFQGVTRRIDRDGKAILALLEDIGSNDFAGAMERRAQTLSGRISTLKDTYANFLDTLGDTEDLKTAVELLTRLFARVTDGVKQIGGLSGAFATLRSVVSSSLAEMARAFGALLQKLGEFKIGGGARAIPIFGRQEDFDQMAAGLRDLARDLDHFAGESMEEAIRISNDLTVGLEEVGDAGLQMGRDLGSGAGDAKKRVEELTKSVEALRAEIIRVRQDQIDLSELTGETRGAGIDEFIERVFDPASIKKLVDAALDDLDPVDPDVFLPSEAEIEEMGDGLDARFRGAGAVLRELLRDAAADFGQALAGALSAAFASGDWRAALQDLVSQVGGILGGVASRAVSTALPGIGGQILGPLAGAGVQVVFNEIAGWLDKTEQTFADGAVMLGRASFKLHEGSGELARLTNQALQSVVDTVNAIAEETGIALQELGPGGQNSFALQIRQRGDEIIAVKAWVDNILHTFDTVQEAIDFLVTEIVTRADTAGADPFVRVALENLADRTVEGLNRALAEALEQQQLVGGVEGLGLGRLAALGIPEDLEDRVRRQAAAWNLERQAMEASLLALRARIMAQQAEAQATAETSRFTVEATQQALEGLELLGRGIQLTGQTAVATGAAMSTAFADALAAVDAALAELDALISESEIEDAIRRQRQAQNRGQREARQRARRDALEELELLQLQATGTQAQIDEYVRLAEWEETVARLTAALGDEYEQQVRDLLELRHAQEQAALAEEEAARAAEELARQSRELAENLRAALDNVQEAVQQARDTFGQDFQSLQPFQLFEQAVVEINARIQEFQALGALSVDQQAELMQLQLDLITVQREGMEFLRRESIANIQDLRLFLAQGIGDQELAAQIQAEMARADLAFRKLEFDLLVEQLNLFGLIDEATQALIDDVNRLFDLAFDLGDEFGNVEREASGLGTTIGRVTSAMSDAQRAWEQMFERAGSFLDRLRGQVGPQDPFSQILRDIAGMRAEAAEIGDAAFRAQDSSLAAVQQMISQLQQVRLDEAFDNLTGGLRSFLDDLTTGPLSGLTLREQTAAAETRLRDLIARAQAGDLEAIGLLEQEGRNLLDLAGQSLGSGGFAQLRNLLRDTIPGILDLGPAGLGFGSGSPFLSATPTGSTRSGDTARGADATETLLDTTRLIADASAAQRQDQITELRSIRLILQAQQQGQGPGPPVT